MMMMIMMMLNDGDVGYDNVDDVDDDYGNNDIF